MTEMEQAKIEEIRAKIAGTNAPPKNGAATAAQNDELKSTLLAAPERIRTAQERFDKADRAWKLRRVTLMIEAFSTPIFPGKKPEDGKRPAGNDTERDAAIELLTLQDGKLITLDDERSDALRQLRFEQNTFDAARSVAALNTSK